ncbi:MAG TPA: M2 family metallopeptidase, partial [Bryobacteraceae bacterium]|nr:M2 family metallopeptidase [Bryobacteraceae bacterium]
MVSIRKTMLLMAALAPGLFAAPPTVQDAKKFMNDAEQRLLDLANEAQTASWVEENFITYDTESLAARANQRATDEQVRLAKESRRFDGLALPPDLARKMNLLRIGFTLATPEDPKESAEVSRLATELDGMYGKGKYCPPALASAEKKCLDINDITRIMATSTNPAELLDVWKGWHAVSPPMRKDFARFVELSNQGARELGFRDTGAMWRSKYDMPPDDFAKELDRLWEQVRPLYVSLHAYVR